MQIDRIPPLVKVFSNKEYACKFLQGELHAKQLSWFKHLEGDGARGDEFEGADIPPPGSSLSLRPFNPYTGETCHITLREGRDFIPRKLGIPLVIKPRHFDHVNIFCVYAAQSGYSHCLSQGNTHNLRKQIKLPHRYLELGEYAVLIRDGNEFLSRVIDVANYKKYWIRCSLVQYYDPRDGTPFMTGNEQIIFAKQKKYAWQREFRIAIEPSILSVGALDFSIGEINHIAELLCTSELI